MFRLILPLIFFPLQGLAGETVSDAFGILPEDALSPERAVWAGLRTGIAPSDVAPEETDAILVFVGPKALVAGKDEGHAVALVLDRHGNLAADGLPVDFVVGEVGMTDPSTRYGIGDVLFTPDPIAGTHAAGAHAGKRQSPRALFRVTADLGSATSSFVDVPPAPFESVTTLRTNDITDRFGNPVESGAVMPLLLRHEDGDYSSATAVVIDGRAEADVLVRNMESGGPVEVTLAGRSLQGTALDLKPIARANTTEVVVWQIPDLDALGLRIGPIMTGVGHMLTDGAPVSVTATTASGDKANAEGWVQDGYFETMLPLPAASESVEVAFETPIGPETRRVTPTVPPLDVRGLE